MKMTVKMKMVILTVVVIAVTIAPSVIGTVNLVNDNKIAAKE